MYFGKKNTFLPSKKAFIVIGKVFVSLNCMLPLINHPNFLNKYGFPSWTTFIGFVLSSHVVITSGDDLFQQLKKIIWKFFPKLFCFPLLILFFFCLRFTVSPIWSICDFFIMTNTSSHILFLNFLPSFVEDLIFT